MTLTRREALKVLGAAAGAVAAASPAPAGARVARRNAPDDLGLLFDATRCIGCRACVTQCREATGTAPDVAILSGAPYDAPVDLNGSTLTVIKLWSDEHQTGYVKAQCMHCADPACASVCMMGALHKEGRGVVAYDVDRCVGCRNCQIACPFNVPKFQWGSASPRIVKCELCRHRWAKGQGPACADACPRGAVVSGPRQALLAEAHRRLEAAPAAYRGGVYGETEAGGTACLYLSPVGFGPLGLPPLGPEPAPALVETVQHGIYQGFVAPVALLGAFAVVSWRNHRRAGREEAP
ncbi:MAG: hydrogenase 2 operon protein HybA [Anaeromyxobacteraceae bacterium]|nr:hydrogenase 2 operon protein HybA [Anaeromyxobacteraceae bacterium]